MLKFVLFKNTTGAVIPATIPAAPFFLQLKTKER